MAKPKDKVGDRFGKLTIVARSGSIGPSAAWLCLCDCGDMRIVRAQHLRQGKANGCHGCNWHRNSVDLTGEKMGPWTALSPAGTRHKLVSWRCLHDDGHEEVVPGSTLYLYRFPDKRLVSRYRCRIGKVLRRGGGYDRGRTLELLGCSASEFCRYICGKFKPGMTMENYGSWHVDHIKPVASFDLSDVGQVSECFHYTNLQPLWASENLSKGAKTGK